MPPTDETSRPARRRALGRGPGVPAAPGPQGHGAAEAPVSAAAPAPEAEAAPVPDAPATPAPVGVVVPEAAPEPGVHGSVTTPAPEAATPVPAAREAPAPEAEAAPAPEAGAPPVPDAPAPAGAPAPQAPPAPVDAAPGEGEGRFRVRLANFEGPFDLLLQLIAKHKMDVTEVALSKVTDEFMAHIRSMGPDWDLDQTTEFLVVAATLLDLKAARLLPAAEVEDEADLALLEARDLLFARLLQYRAYKRIAEIFEGRLDDEARRFPRTVGLEPHHADLLPDVVISIGAEGFARLAVKAMQPKPRPQVYVDHIHAPLVSVREQAEVVVALLRERGTASFRELTEGVDDTLTVVARFLALLELYREKVLVLEQPEALGELTVTWAAGDGAAEVTVTDEFDQVVEEKE
ncbi:segregation and condensation protein A [Streptomyces zhihengii]